MFASLCPHIYARISKTIITPLDNPNHTDHRLEKLPFEKWRYWILFAEESLREIDKLQHAANLIHNDLSFGYTVFEEGSYKGGSTGNAYELSHYFGDAISLLMESPKTLKTEELELIGKYHNLINSLDPEFQPIYRVLQSFQHLKYIPDFSDLKIIGYFSIIESLITHPPKILGSEDSITHQIKTKIPLLQRRFDRVIDYSEFFREAKEEKIWTKLYEYRSRVAHGGELDFKKSLRILKSHQAVQGFLKEITKLLIISSLRDPGFIFDLQRC